jgi:2-methylisocitrate lyase-like PEP mutase family enzyme
MRPGGPTVPELAAAGVARITVGGAFAFAALGALVEAATELRDAGTTGYGRLSQIGQQAASQAFSHPQ